MYRFAVCEDEAESLRFLSAHLKKNFLNRGIQVELDSYHSGMELIKGVEEGKNYDVIYLDIAMPEVDGFEVCRRLKTWESDSLVVFISNNERLVFDSFRLQPFRFIRKEDFLQEIDGLVEDIVHQLNKQNTQLIFVKEPRSGKDFFFSTKATLYIEAQGKNCKISERDRDVLVKCRFSDMQRLFEGYGFIQVHRSYLVNYRYINAVQGYEICLDNGVSIPASRDRIPDIKKLIMIWNRR